MNRLSALIRCLAQPKRLYKLGVRTGAEERMLIHVTGKHTLMYWMVFSSFGRTTLSKAFTRLLVVLIASSRVRNAVCRDASCTSSSIEFMNALRHVCIC